MRQRERERVEYLGGLRGRRGNRVETKREKKRLISGGVEEEEMKQS